jgi:hypothetical protein
MVTTKTTYSLTISPPSLYLNRYSQKAASVSYHIEDYILYPKTFKTILERNSKMAARGRKQKASLL